MFSFGFKGHIGDIIWSLDSRLDMFFVNYFTGVAGVGYYSLAVSLGEKIWFLPSPLKTSTAPIISGSPGEKAVDLTAKTNRHIIFMNSMMALLLILAVPWAVVLFYGSEYSPAIVPLLLLLPGIIFGRSVFSNYVTGHLGKPQIATAITLINSIVYLPLSFFAIKFWGIKGAALASSVFYLLQYLLFFIYFKKHTKMGILDILILRRTDIDDYRKILGKFWLRKK